MRRTLQWMDVFNLTDKETIPFARLYRHLRMDAKKQTFEAFCNIPMVADLTKQVTSVILKDPNDTWPPESAKNSVPAVIDVPAVNEIVRCHSFSTGDLTISMSVKLAAVLHYDEIEKDAQLGFLEQIKMTTVSFPKKSFRSRYSNLPSYGNLSKSQICYSALSPNNPAPTGTKV